MSRMALLICLLCVGCGLDVTPPRPKPEPVPVAAPTIDGMTAAFNDGLRRAYLEGAENLRSGKWKTAKEYLEGQTDLIDGAFDTAAQPLADREQAETGTGWTPEKSAAYLETIAREGRTHE